MRIELQFTRTKNNNFKSANVNTTTGDININSIWNVTSIKRNCSDLDSSLNEIVKFKYCQAMTDWIKNVIINFSLLTNEKNKICGFEIPLKIKHLLNFNKEIDNNDIKTTLTRWCHGHVYPLFDDVEPYSLTIESSNSQTQNIYELESLSLRAIAHDIFGMY